MAHRLTETDKWKNPLFRKLPTNLKLFLLYALDNCDNSGVLYFDEELISFYLNEQITRQEVLKKMTHFIKEISEEKLYIRHFIYGQKNNNNEKMKKNIDKLLEKHGILEKYNTGELDAI